MEKIFHINTKFPNSLIADEAFKKLRDLVFVGNLDLSVYLLTYDGKPHVSVIGEPIPDLFHPMIEKILEVGKQFTLPEDVQLFLKKRRTQEITELHSRGPDNLPLSQN